MRVLAKATAKATQIFFSKKIQHICVSLDVNFNESLTNDIFSFEQLGPDFYRIVNHPVVFTADRSKAVVLTSPCGCSGLMSSLVVLVVLSLCLVDHV